MLDRVLLLASTIIIVCFNFFFLWHILNLMGFFSHIESNIFRVLNYSHNYFICFLILPFYLHLTTILIQTQIPTRAV